VFGGQGEDGRKHGVFRPGGLGAGSGAVLCSGFCLISLFWSFLIASDFCVMGWGERGWVFFDLWGVFRLHGSLFFFLFLCFFFV